MGWKKRVGVGVACNLRENSKKEEPLLTTVNNSDLKKNIKRKEDRQRRKKRAKKERNKTKSVGEEEAQGQCEQVNCGSDGTL